ncbi:hypothetical protein HNY73_011897 [Argiope bruennichi]|uniref:Uncharacterized protein n=1 Tax=Argiope bruennichi TaxID=94029 RepID=A0A8T0EY15_ARGBR|nr:hypothetical protein HNY73_011897 [Argiope bruennichi]
MSLKSSISNSSSNGSSVTRFILDGVVAEMLVEIEDEQEPLLSPSKAFKLNEIDNYEELKDSCLRHSFVALDPILKMDDIKISNMENQEQNKSNSEPDKTDVSSKKLKEDQTSFKSDVLNDHEVSMSEKSDLKEVKESDNLDEDNDVVVVEIVQKDLNKRNEDQLTVDEVTETNEDKLPDPDECKSQVEMRTKKDEVEFQEEGENKSTFEETIKIQKLIEKDENKSITEKKMEISEGQSMQERNEIKSPADLSETNKAQLSEKDGNNTVLEEMTETNEAHPLEKYEYKSVKKEVDETKEIHPSEMNTKSEIDRLTETIVVACEPIELEMLNDKALSGVKKSSKLPLKKRKLKEPEKAKEDVKEEDKPKSRTLRTRPSEKEKKDVKKTDTKKRKDISSKSTPVPAKKAKIVKEENPKKGIKRSLLDDDETKSVGKRLRSAVQDNSQMQKRSQASTSVKSEIKDKKSEIRTKKPELKNVKTEVKKTKLDIKSKKPETKNTKPDIKSKKPEMNIKSKKPEMRSKKPEIKSSEIKRQSLRKTTLQKSTNAPVPVISSKPKVYNLNPGKVTNLGVFAEIKERVNESDMKYLRYLYRILYDQWPPRDIDALKEEILNFEGYNFNKKSQDLQKREQVLKKMPDTSVIEICKILALKVDSKENMISDIIKFLLKPVKIVISTVDPFDPSMQPVVKLERIVVDEYLNRITKNEDKTPVPVKRSTRERYPSTKLEIYVSDVSEKLPMPSVKDEQKNSQLELKIEKNSKGESSKNITLKKTTVNKTKTTAKNTAEMNKGTLTAKYAKRRKKGFKFSQKKNEHNCNARKKLMKLAAKIQTTKSPEKQNSEVEDIENTIIPNSEIKLEPIVEELGEVKELNETEESGSHAKHFVSGVSKDISSDTTLSSDEAKQVTKTGSPRKRVSHKRVGKPLRYFTKIKENILNANFSALQRLHILLFGASDKADNLKGNILAFGGFPFLEGSEEWRQKEFLLSLLAQNTLREYLNLLCIEYTDDDQKALIRKLMKFLAAPSDSSPSTEIRTQVVSSEPVNCAPAHLIKAPGRKKKTKKTEEKKKSRTRKVLMDEAQVKRLEADLAREQRILERERKLHEEQVAAQYSTFDLTPRHMYMKECIKKIIMGT